MPEHQSDFAFDIGYNSAPAASPDLRDEIAQARGLPLRECVEVSFRGGQLDAVTGVLELVAAPDFPWNPRAPLQLRVAGFTFSSREIACWTKL
jgi:hypothetical protein